MVKSDRSAVQDKKDPIKAAKKTGVSVAEFADEIRIPVDRLLVQFKNANIPIEKEEDIVSEKEKQDISKMKYHIINPKN